MNRIQVSLSSALLLATSIVAACSQTPGTTREGSGTSNESGSTSSGSGSGAGSSTGSSSGTSTGTASGTSARSGAATGSASGQSGKGTSSGVGDASLDGPSQETSDGGADDAAMPPDCVTPTTVQTCAPPVNTVLPICDLSLTGCMDPTTPTMVNAKAVYYEVNSPLWSDNAAKTRAFILPANGKIHVKDCNADAGDAALSADCVSDRKS